MSEQNGDGFFELIATHFWHGLAALVPALVAWTGYLTYRSGQRKTVDERLQKAVEEGSDYDIRLASIADENVRMVIKWQTSELDRVRDGLAECERRHDECERKYNELRIEIARAGINLQSVVMPAAARGFKVLEGDAPTPMPIVKPDGD